MFGFSKSKHERYIVPILRVAASGPPAKSKPEVNEFISETPIGVHETWYFECLCNFSGDSDALIEKAGRLLTPASSHIVADCDCGDSANSANSKHHVQTDRDQLS